MRPFSSIAIVFGRWTRLSWSARLLWTGAAFVGAAVILCVLLFAYALVFIAPTLPSIEAVVDYRPKMPLRVYTADQVLIGEFGEERRDFVPVDEIPEIMKQAVIAIEDDRFYEHGGVDLVGVLRAGVANLRSSRSQGASTITMQVARAFFLTRKKTYSRKLQEILLAYKIEQRLPKDKILELYMNQIYLGERAYGFGSASRVYFGKPLQEVSVAEAAMLAGLPQAPAAANPVVNPQRAAARQQLVLRRMRELGYLTPAQFEQAAGASIKLVKNTRRFDTHAEYAAEMVRQLMYAQFKDEIYTSGMSVVTTLRKADQDAAYEAVRRGVMDYERRHGYRGPEAFVELPGDAEERQDLIDETLLKYPDSDDLRSAVVLAASPRAVRAQLLSGDVVEIGGDGLRFAAPFLAARAKQEIRIRPGSVIRVTADAKGRWSIAQLPEVAAAFVALDAQDGAMRAMVGGFDFGLNKFDHVSQAWRQPGSTIKPFVYSAALEKGFSPSTMINDAPLNLNVSDSGGKLWQPQNDDGSAEGPVSMRTGLKRSKNLVSIRILQTITPAYAQEYLTRFGFEAARHPVNLTLTLGTGSVTPLQMASAYAVFANGGFQVTPYLIHKIVDARGKVISETLPMEAGDENSRVLDERNAFLMDSMMRDVVQSGTAAAAGQRLGRKDIAGKTGTTDDAIDGWFAGYGGKVVGVAWMGYDKPRSLGNKEFGGTLALPIWADYMRVALKGQPRSERVVPAGLVQVNGDWMYEEFANGGGVGSVDVQDTRSFWQKLFGSPAPGAPMPAPPPGPTPDELEKKRLEELYRG